MRASCSSANAIVDDLFAILVANFEIGKTTFGDVDLDGAKPIFHCRSAASCAPKCFASHRGAAQAFHTS